MKPIFVPVLLFAFLVPLIASADVIPADHHTVIHCSKFVNLGEFKDLVLIGRYRSVGGEYTAYQIVDGECFSKGYKFNSFDAYWTTKREFQKLDIQDLDVSNLRPLPKNVYPSGTYSVKDDDPLIKKEVQYSISSFSGDAVEVYESKHIFEYNDGTPKKIEKFRPPEGGEKEIPTQGLSFWETIKESYAAVGCFLRKLLGSSCQS